MYRSGALHGTHSRKTAQKLPKGDKDKQTEGIKAIIQATRLEGSLFPQSNEKTEGDKIMLITEELLRKGMTQGVGIKSIQARVLGLKYPLQKGWLKGLIGKEITEEKAKADNFIGWDRHHRLETHNSDGERRLVNLTVDELKALDMYYNRPAEELI